MKTLITLFVLFFLSFAFADDISDFEIEGMSIGDSLLDYFSKDQIENKKKSGFVYSDKKFYSITFYDEKNFKLYNAVQFHIKDLDNKFIIYSIAGKIYFDERFNECIQKLDEILPEIKKIFNYSNFQDYGTNIWKNNKGYDVKSKSYLITLPSKDQIYLACKDQHKDMDIKDNLIIALDSYEFAYWLDNH